MIGTEIVSAAEAPHVEEISSNEEVTTLSAGHRSRIKVGQTTDGWTLMAVVDLSPEHRGAVFEDFTDQRGHLVIVDATGLVADFPKSLAPAAAEQGPAYRGHSLAEVLSSDTDLLGSGILAQSGDPKYADVAACLAPITRMATYTFVGTPDSEDKVGFAYGGRSPAFDPAIFEPRIRQWRDERRVADGLVGGWLPAVRFVYPESAGTWTEMVAFAPMRLVNGNRWAQPVWYRVVRVENRALVWVHYVDTYVPSPPRSEPAAQPFYEDLLTLREGWDAELAPGMEVHVPEQWAADLARHSLVRALITRAGDEPKYGAVDRNYGGTEHDGFPDTFNVAVAACCDWGLLDRAGRAIDAYLGKFVRDDGSLLYRGPETGQYGRMLTVAAQYVSHGGDARLAVKYRVRLDAIARLLLSLRRRAQELPPENPAYGMIAGWSEADSSLDPEPERYRQPYYGNSTEAARGFHDLGRIWEELATRSGDAAWAEWGRTLVREGAGLESDIRTSLARSRIATTDPVCLPAIAGARVPFHLAVAKDPLDPLHRGYRSYMEMLYSGLLDRNQVGEIMHYRAAHRDSILGLPTAYGFNTHEVAGFLSYGQAYGLLQRDFIREFLLMFYSLSAHQYTRGTWTAPETRQLADGVDAAPYCVPAQLVEPLLLRWMLAFEEPEENVLWLAKATPRDWLADGQSISAQRVPTRWGRVGFIIESHLAQRSLHAEINLPPTSFPAEIRIRFRAPDGARLDRVMIDGELSNAVDPAGETVTISAGRSGRVSIDATLRLP
ncbi:MAG TPA: hypothetical protein VGM73_10190 [Candidatus Didemnitutus sp.]